MGIWLTHPDIDYAERTGDTRRGAPIAEKECEFEECRCMISEYFPPFEDRYGNTFCCRECAIDYHGIVWNG